MKSIFFFLFIWGLSISAIAQQDPGNYDESKIPHYSLPDPLVFTNGTQVVTKGDWFKRRKEISRLFSTEVYGIIPRWRGKIESTPVSRTENALDGLATREEVALIIKNGDKQINALLIIYLPHSSQRVPVFLGYNFYGNQTITNEQDITLTSGWVRNNKDCKITDHKATEASRGAFVPMWPLKEIVSRGYGVVTLNYGDIEPDDRDDFKNGAQLLFDQHRDSTSWGKISTWAWGLSRVMDYLETNSKIDAKKVAILGHSRLGKTVLWADPKGEFLSCVNASQVFKLLGKEGFPADTMPPLNHPVIGTIGYHIRTGKHDVTPYDWQCYMNFADYQFSKKTN